MIKDNINESRRNFLKEFSRSHAPLENVLWTL